MADDAPTPDITEPDATGLLVVIERLEAMLAHSELTELEVEVGGTAVVLRKSSALPPALSAELLAAVVAGMVPGPGATIGEPVEAEPEAGRHAVLAPLTGIYYGAPAPDTAPYVRVGGEVNVGQVIGLIEAMKLFNEIKSDIAGRVVRIVPDNGTLVKAKQPLLEVEPL